jgi:hypothetical protein
MLRLLPGIIDLVLTVVAVVDIVLIDPSRVRAVPKWVWIVISILLFIVGPLLWFFVGRIRLPREATAGPLAPDDDPEFLRGLGEQGREQRRRDDDSDDPKPSA